MLRAILRLMLGNILELGSSRSLARRVMRSRF